MARLFRFECKSVQRPRDPAELGVRYELPDRYLRRRSQPVGLPNEKRSRFACYLASSFRNERAVRQVPRVERNKLIVMTIFLGLIAFAVVYHMVVG